jgi:hypothetical protein
MPGTQCWTPCQGQWHDRGRPAAPCSPTQSARRGEEPPDSWPSPLKPTPRVAQMWQMCRQYSHRPWSAGNGTAAPGTQSHFSGQPIPRIGRAHTRVTYRGCHQWSNAVDRSGRGTGMRCAPSLHSGSGRLLNAGFGAMANVPTAATWWIPSGAT